MFHVTHPAISPSLSHISLSLCIWWDTYARLYLVNLWLPKRVPWQWHMAWCYGIWLERGPLWNIGVNCQRDYCPAFSTYFYYHCAELASPEVHFGARAWLPFLPFQFLCVFFAFYIRVHSYKSFANSYCVLFMSAQLLWCQRVAIVQSVYVKSFVIYLACATSRLRPSHKRECKKFI